LTGSVVDLKLHVSLLLFALTGIINFDHSRAKIYTYGQVVFCSEAFVRELHEEAGLSNGGVSNNDVFEEKRVRHFLVR
jgi:8-oxo-dGTP pyrophosphatase MutT (NUDIX family)